MNINASIIDQQVRGLTQRLRAPIEATQAPIEEIRSLLRDLGEGFNRKARVVTSRAYGFQRFASFASMLLLCCGGLSIPWPHVIPV